MIEPADGSSPETLAAIEALLERGGPLLIEAHFPRMGMPSSWYLLDDMDDIRALIERLRGAAVLYLEPVWDLKNPENSGMAVKP